MAKIADLKEEDGILTFTLTGVEVCYANAVRRTILSDIPIVVFKTTPHNENKCNILENTSRLHNEILKQRLSCIPICIRNVEDNSFKNYILEVDVENNTDTMLVVTTKDFKIKNTLTDTYLEAGEVKKIFPPFEAPTGEEYYIDFVRLRPRISEEIPGEKLRLTCEFSVATARDDSMFNVTGTCSYGFTPNQAKILEQLEIRKQKWKDEGKKEDEIHFEAENWKLLEGLRYVTSRSYDFIIQSIGIYDNVDLIIRSCHILAKQLQDLRAALDSDKIDIHPSNNTLDNCYDVVLENEHYTIGNILNQEIYAVFYTDLKVLDYAGFKKMHPHDSESILRLSLADKTKSVSTVKTILEKTLEIAIQKIDSIRGCFDGSRLADQSLKKMNKSTI
jgi:DNA-directed RNA polymerase subunit L/DNA-directed RNA polymerase alpha subunit